MPEIDSIAQGLTGELKKGRADYLEARFEESENSHITYRGRVVESVGRSAASGGNVRALVKGGWGFTSFNDFTGLNKRVSLAVDQAKAAGHGKSELAEIPAVTDSVPSSADKNPVGIPLEEKKKLLDEFNEITWSTPNIQTSTIGYSDSRKKIIFLSSDGSFIAQERADVTLRLTAIAAKGGEVQQVGLSLGSRGNFSAITKIHQQVKEMAQHAVDLLTAPEVKGGEYTVVLDPVLAGVFVHEAFGHLSESDFVYENERMKDIMVLGKEFGGPQLNIIDSASDPPGLRGSFKYDDEGVKAVKTYLIREGKLVGRLHSRETAAKMGEKPTGNARAITYRFPPIVRMTNTYIVPGTASFNDIIADTKEGIYVKNWYGGVTSMEMFTFSAGEAYMIRGGKIAEAVRPVKLTGNVFTTLKNIDAIGNDLDMNEGGGCGKGGQSPLAVSNGSPHIRIRHCLIGGK
ncbi:MAG TPA: TldD/PmbA family protein [Dehalococcoidales bacterium]|nr:TldD/PmbA family protein [Dehalococcoidales bacterium]